MGDFMVYVYVLEGVDTGKRYVGITNNLDRRLIEHRSKRTKGGQLLGDFTLLHVEHFRNYNVARKREIFLKSGQGRKLLTERYPRTRPA